MVAVVDRLQGALDLLEEVAASLIA